MKFLILVCILALNTVNAQTPLTNTFTYQGELKFNNALANGLFDFKFSVFDVETAGSVLEIVTVNGVTVTNGVFSTPITLMNDLFTGNKIWLDIEVKTNGTADPFDPLSPRQEVTSSPYAIHAQFVDLSTIPSWNIGGNAAGAGNFIGTTNAEPFVVKVKNIKVIEIQDAFDLNNNHSPNILMGSDSNSLSTQAVGMTIAGGFNNVVVAGGHIDNFATISGGARNALNGFSSTISGGSDNTIGKYGATIGGGSNNIVNEIYGTVPGGTRNQAGGPYSFAAGKYAIVRDTIASGDADGDEGTFVWSDSTASGIDKFTSTGPNQFRVRATGGAYFDVSSSGLSPPGFHIEQQGASGVGMLIRQTSTDANLVLVNKGTGDLIKAFTGSGGGNLIFRVDSNGNVSADGGYTSNGADFAEYLPSDEIDLQVAEVVGLNNGKLGRDTSHAQRVMVISTNPAFVGNNDKQGNTDKALVAFTGQVPVKVRSAVRAGDWLMASGHNDGYAQVVQLDKIKSLAFRQIVGQALESSDGDRVLTLVGLPAHALMAKQQELISEQQLAIKSQQQQITTLQNQQQQILAQLQQTQELKQQLAEIKLMLKQNSGTGLLVQNKKVRYE